MTTKAETVIYTMKQAYDYAVANKLNVWVAACGGQETPIQLRSGNRVLYCYNPALAAFAYVNLDTGTVMTIPEAAAAFERG